MFYAPKLIKKSVFIIVFFITSVSSFAAQQSFEQNTTILIGADYGNNLLSQKKIKKQFLKQI